MRLKLPLRAARPDPALVNEILASELFDVRHYNQQRHIEDRDPTRAVEHYLSTGSGRGLNPSPYFDTEFYLACNPDVAQAGINPFVHFLRNGAAEGRDPFPLFNTKYYLRNSPDVAAAGANPLRHYLSFGETEGRSPYPFFDPLYYRAQCKDLPSLPRHGLLHFLKRGGFEGRNPSPYFDCRFYLERSPDVLEAGVNPLVHFVTFGAKEGRAPRIGKLDEHVRQLLRQGRLEDARTLFVLSPSNRAISGSEPVGFNVELESAEAYLRRRGQLLHYTPGRTVKLRAPRVQGMDGPPEGHAETPPAYVGFLNDARVVGGTRIVTPEPGRVLSDELTAFANTDYGVKPWMHLLREDGAAVVRCAIGSNTEIEEGILISSDHDNNYYHWLVECLPKVAFVDSVPELAGLPLLVGQDLHPNLVDALTKVNRSGRPVLRLKDGLEYRVQKLWWPADLSRVLDRYSGVPEHRDCVLAPEWIRTTVDLLAGDEAFPAAPWRKIYLTRRTAHTRKLRNEAELERALIRDGFEITDLNGASLETQIALLRQASVVVAPTGAALTNMMFCAPGATVVVLTSNHPSTNFFLFSQLADLMGVNFEVVTGRRLYTSLEYPVHDDYRIEVDDVLSALARIGKKAAAC